VATFHDQSEFGVPASHRYVDPMLRLLPVTSQPDIVRDVVALIEFLDDQRRQPLVSRPVLRRHSAE
jgi:hypothetical protein